MKKKILAGLLSLCMIFSLVPMTAFAEATTLPEAVNGVITLTENVVLSSTYNVDGTVTIDLNGYTISDAENSNFTHLIQVDCGDNLTITDNVGGGSIIRKYVPANYSTVISNEQGTVTINGGIIDHQGNSTLNYAIDVRTNCDGDSGNASLYINGGTIKSTKYAVRLYGNAWENTDDAVVVEFNNGTIEGTSAFYVMNQRSDSAMKLTVDGGDINVSKNAMYVWDASNTNSKLEKTDIDFNDGNISGNFGFTMSENAELEFVISGGTFSNPDSVKQYVEAGYHACADGANYVIHKVNSVDVVPATCKVTGTAAHYKCEAGKLYSDAKGTQEITDPTTLVIAVVPHTSKDVAAVAPTCTETGLTAGTACSVCGDVLTAQQTVAATDHSWGEWTVTIAPSCTEKGVETRVCANDSTHKETRDVATAAHTWGYNTQYDAAAHWNHCHICGAQGELTAHSDANHEGYCDCGWSMTSAPGRANPNTGVHY